MADTAAVIGIGDTVRHLADRDAEFLVSGVVQFTANLEGCDQALVQWSDAVDDPRWSPVANLVKIAA